MLTSSGQTLRVRLHTTIFPSRFTSSLCLMVRSMNGGGGGFGNGSSFLEGAAQKQPLPGTCLTNPFVKEVKFGAGLLTM